MGFGCVAGEPPSDNVGYEQNYMVQFYLNVPNLVPNSINFAARDQVSLYTQTDLGAFGPAGWSQNALINANKDSASPIITELDLNNNRGCDSPGIDSSSTGGSASFVATRSDGSGCKGANGLVITGIADNTSASAIAIQYAPNGQSHAMWQDGISIQGGYNTAEYDFISNTASTTSLKIKGAHAQHAVDMLDGGFTGGALALNSTNSTNGKIGWYCPASGCVSGYPTTASIAPGGDGTLHVGGVPLTVETGTIDPSLTTHLATQTTMSQNGMVVGTPSGSPLIFAGFYAPEGWSNWVSEWQVGGTELAYLTSLGQLNLPDSTGSLVVSGSETHNGTEQHNIMNVSTVNGTSVNATTLTFDPTGSPPSSSSSLCARGQTAWGAIGGNNYFFVCVASNTWQRVALSAW